MGQAGVNQVDDVDPYLSWACELQARGLAFNTEDDAVHLANVLVEQSRNYLAGHNLTAGERYIAGDGVIKIQLRARGHSGDFPFVLVAAAYKSTKAPKPFHERTVATDNDNVDIHAQHNLMFVWTGDPAKCPEKIIPSVVWFEILDEGDYVGMYPETLSLDDIINLDDFPAKREVNLLCGDRIQHQSAAVNGLIEGVPEVIQGVRCGGAEVAGNLAFKADFIDILTRVRVSLNEWECSANFVEGQPLRCEIGVVFFGPLN